MTVSLAIALILFADLALIAGVAYVMSRAKGLTPHIAAPRAAVVPTPTAAGATHPAVARRTSRGARKLVAATR
jgi:hypothetical protein